MMIDDIVNAINSSAVGELTPQEHVLKEGIEALNSGNQPIYRNQSRGFLRGSEEVLEGQSWDNIRPKLETIAKEQINVQPTHFAFNAKLVLNEMDYQTAVEKNNLNEAKNIRNQKIEILDQMKNILYEGQIDVIAKKPHLESSRTKIIRDLADIARKGGNPHEAYDTLGNPEITQDSNTLLDRGKLKYDAGDNDTAERHIRAAYDMDPNGDVVGKEASGLLANLYNIIASQKNPLKVTRAGVDANILTEFDKAETLDGTLRFTKARAAYTSVLNMLNERAPAEVAEGLPDPNEPYKILEAATLRQLARYDVGDGKIKSAIDRFRESIAAYATKEAYQGLAGAHSKIATPTQG